MSEESGSRVIVEHDVEAPMRDGILLRADVYRPAGEGRYPVLLCRTPYNKQWQRFVDTSRIMAARGYTVIMQDVRGRHTSDGEWRWQFRERSETPEAEDGFDSVEWAAGLASSNGDVGIWGHSYDGWNGWMAASARPPSLKALAATGINENVLDLTRGIFETGRRVQWSHKMASDMRRRRGGTGGPVSNEQAEDWWATVYRSKYLWWLPLGELPEELFDDLTDQFQTYLRHQDREFWHLADIHSEITVPVLVITGWWDRLIGAVDHYAGLVRSGPEPLRTRHRLVIGPWGHDVTGFERPVGPIDYGPASRVRYADLLTRWFDHVLKGISNGVESEDPVQVFVPGHDEWRGEVSWPPANVGTKVLHLTADTPANTVAGGGRLVPDPPVADGRDGYAYDPRDPVMSLMAPDSQAAPVDQSPHDHRRDVLVYETDPFESAIEFVGPVAIHLWAESDAPDTDWAVKLAIVQPDGFAMNLTYGIVRARYRDGFDRPSPIEPHRSYEYRIELNPMGYRFAAGTRLRLYVSSSDFPNYDRNHNTGADFWTDPELRVANQTILHGPSTPSRLVLSVVPIDA